ncbi:hypothetical protein KCP70_07275 [Salmonella enterica subsp. enterica]|nr:hypothetical protein KCP70_07275 [Salmonella enterica subsp. enterica]
MPDIMPKDAPANVDATARVQIQLTPRRKQDSYVVQAGDFSCAIEVRMIADVIRESKRQPVTHRHGNHPQQKGIKICIVHFVQFRAVTILTLHEVGMTSVC